MHPCFTVTLTIRFMALPLTVLQLRSTALMHNHMPTLQKLQQKLLEAQRSSDPHQSMCQSINIPYSNDQMNKYYGGLH